MGHTWVCLSRNCRHRTCRRTDARYWLLSSTAGTSSTDRSSASFTTSRDVAQPRCPRNHRRGMSDPFPTMHRSTWSPAHRRCPRSLGVHGCFGIASRFEKRGAVVDAQIPLDAAVRALRSELHAAMRASRDEDLQFRLGPVELELGLEVSNEVGTEAGVRSGWYRSAVRAAENRWRLTG